MIDSKDYLSVGEGMSSLILRITYQWVTACRD